MSIFCLLLFFLSSFFICGFQINTNHNQVRWVTRRTGLVFDDVVQWFDHKVSNCCLQHKNFPSVPSCLWRPPGRNRAGGELPQKRNSWWDISEICLQGHHGKPAGFVQSQWTFFQSSRHPEYFSWCVHILHLLLYLPSNTPIFLEKLRFYSELTGVVPS